MKVTQWNHAATATTGASAIGVVILAFVPYFAGGPVEQPLIVLCTFITMAAMWNLLAGFSGLTSFGQHAYLGVGAYGLYLVAVHGVNPFAGIVLAALIAAVVSVPVSFLLLRLSGGYFAVASLVIAAVFQIVATLSPSVGGSTGVTIPGLAGYSPLLREAMIYWAALIIAVLAMVVVYLLVRGRFGLDARAAGSEPVAAASLGVRTGRVRRVAYLVAAAGAGAAGALLGLQTLYIEPADELFAPVQRLHAVHGPDRRDGHDRGTGHRRADPVRAAADPVPVRRLVPGSRRRARSGRDTTATTRDLGIRQ